MPLPAESHIPLVNLELQHLPLQAELLEALAAVASSQCFINGPAVGEFEAVMAARLGVKHTLGVSSGTDALLMVLAWPRVTRAMTCAHPARRGTPMIGPGRRRSKSCG